MPDEGAISLAEAFSISEGELDGATSDGAEATLPVVEADPAGEANTAADLVEAKPDEEQGEEESLNLEGFDDLFGPDGESTPVDTSSPEFQETRVTIDTVAGPETLTIAELKDGYLRRADYTQKTQDVAAQRRAAEDAVTFHKSFTDNPLEFARTLAVRAGLLDEGAEPIKAIEAATIPTAETVEEMVEQRLQERLGKDPSIQNARLVEARAAIAASFDKIEETHNTTLNKTQREAVIQEAVRRGTTDLELTFEAMLGRLQTQQSRRKASAARPTGTARASATEAAKEALPENLEAAFLEAEAELAGA